MKRPLNTRILDLYLELGRELFPLVPDGKEPLQKSWRKRRYTPNELYGYLKRGCNMGWRLGPLDCVIDVDPRNNGKESLKQLVRDLYTFDLSEKYPTVQTGGGGTHYYTTLPERISIKKNLPIYPGIDFLSFGRYVVIAGSSHPSGTPYRFDEMSPFRGMAKQIPKILFEQIGKFELEDDIAKISACKTIATRTLKQLLKQLPVEEFDSDETWFPIMVASHHATQGFGLKVFLKWSLGDPRYSDHGDLISRRWKSLRHDSDSQITVNTIYSEIIKRGGDLPPLAVVRDFEILDGLDEKEVAEVQSAEGDKAKSILERKYSRVKVVREARKLTKYSAAKAVHSVLDKCHNFSELDTEQILAIIRTRTEMPLTSLRRTLAERRRKALASEDEIEDLGYYLAQDTLKTIRNDRESDLIFAIDGQFWEFGETHWEPIPYAVMRSQILDRAKALKKDNPNIAQPVSGLVQQASLLIEAETATQTDIFGFRKPPKAIINVKNCELHINTKSGKFEEHEHDLKSHLTYCLNSEYDPKAKCKLFDRTLSEIFEYQKPKERKEIIRHLWEVIGYTIQPNKDIAVWVLFHGSGSNGKTLILNIISELLGQFALEKSIRDLDTTKNSHAFADLPGKLAVIDEDVNSQALIPDGSLKKVSENKMLVANPKNRPTFRFLNTAIAYLSSNSWPKTRDLSYGLKRRALVFDFDRRFTPAEIDIARGKKIVASEMPGILNKALAGLRRLRFRGGFEIPEPCQQALDKWYIESNQFLKFLEDHYYPTITRKGTSFESMWEKYIEWTYEQGAKRHYSKQGIRQALESMGYGINPQTDRVSGLLPEKLNGE
ncbi:hypothetical protein GWN42_13435 [candidate division KSB1 bacterium]|nr:hypothetical protein [candidate division KSB1 bacterium]